MTINLLGFQSKGDNKNKPSGEEINSLRIENDSLKIELNKMMDRIKRNEIRLESVDALVATSNNYLSYANWVGAGITVLLFFVGVYTIISFNISKREIDKHLEKSKKEVEEAKSLFDNFINSPKEIKKVIENINYQEIIEGLNSEEERIFNVNITRAYNLPADKRLEIATNIKSKLYDPHYHKLFFQLYYFLKQNLNITIQEYAYDIWESFDGTIPNNSEHILITDIFSNKPYPINPIDFLKTIIEQKKKNLFYSLITSLNGNDLIELVKETLEQNMDIEYSPFLNKTKELGFNLTEYVKQNLDNINDTTFDKIYTEIQYDKDIVKNRLAKNTCLDDECDKYIRNVINGPNEFSFLVNQLDGSEVNNWISLFNYHLSNDPMELKMEVLWERYKELQDSLPKLEFYLNDLPLFFEKNYGIIKKGDEYYYREVKLSPVQETNFFIGQTYSVVVHPLLKKKIHIDRIT